MSNGVENGLAFNVKALFEMEAVSEKIDRPKSYNCGCIVTA